MSVQRLGESIKDLLALRGINMPAKSSDPILERVKFEIDQSKSRADPGRFARNISDLELWIKNGAALAQFRKLPDVAERLESSLPFLDQAKKALLGFQQQ